MLKRGEIFESSLEQGAPPSRPMAQSKRLPEVTLPIVPLMKQIDRALLITTPATRLLVPCIIISMRGLPVRVVRIASGSGMQKRRTMTMAKPLVGMSVKSS